MPLYRFMSTLYPTSGLQKDATVNTFHASHASATPPYGTVRDAWAAFYNDRRPQIAASVRQNDHTLKAYDLADDEPRVPRYEATWNFTTAPSGDSLPAEIAYCVSFQGARFSGLDQARRRGRIYCGPFNEATNDNGRPGGSTALDWVNAFKTFIEAINVDDWTFVVYSRVNEAPVTVTNVWADNAWDVQRRRGLVTTARSSANVSQPIP